MFFFNDTATTEIYTLSLHDALPIFDRVAARDGEGAVLDLAVEARPVRRRHADAVRARGQAERVRPVRLRARAVRSEEHTSELQSRQYLVCRLLLEKKKTSLFHFFPL